MSTGPRYRRHVETGNRFTVSNVFSTNWISLQTFEFSCSYQTYGQPNAPIDMTALLHQFDTCPAQLRIICAPYEARSPEGNAELKSMMDHYKVPAAVQTDRARSVTHSFGTQTVMDGSIELAWNHFLNSNISIRADENARVNVAGSSWIMSDYMLHVQRSQQAGQQDRSVTLLCFGAPPAVIQCFRHLESNGNWHSIYDEPFLGFDVIYTALFLLVDEVAWALADVFWPVENSTLGLAEEGGKAAFRRR